MKKFQSLLSVIVLALLAIVIAWQLLPVTQGSAATQDEIVEFQFWRTQGLIADGCSSAVNARINTKVQPSLIVTMPTVNTTTFSLQHSNDGVFWHDGADIGSDIVTDTSTLTEVTNLGVFTRLCADVATADRFTVTSRGLFKP